MRSKSFQATAKQKLREVVSGQPWSSADLGIVSRALGARRRRFRIIHRASAIDSAILEACAFFPVTSRGGRAEANRHPIVPRSCDHAANVSGCSGSGVAKVPTPVRRALAQSEPKSGETDDSIAEVLPLSNPGDCLGVGDLLAPHRTASLRSRLRRRAPSVLTAPACAA